MKLKSYLIENGYTAEEFGDLVGATKFAVGKWARDERIPGRLFMSKIEAVTGGLVTAGDFYAPAQSQRGAA